MDAAHSSAWAAAHAYPVGAVGWAEMLNQGFSGLMLQLLKSRCGDVDGQGVGLGFQVAVAFSQNAEHNLTHVGGISFLPEPSLACWRVLEGAPGYGEPPLRAPAIARS